MPGTILQEVQGRAEGQLGAVQGLLQGEVGQEDEGDKREEKNLLHKAKLLCETTKHWRGN